MTKTEPELLVSNPAGQVYVHRLVPLPSQTYVGRPALFLDRDGVVNYDSHYVSDPASIRLLDGVVSVVTRCNDIGIPVFVVTNQSGISRGFYDWSDYDRVTHRLVSIMGPLSKFTAIYANSYHHEQASQGWRKPGPNMLLQSSIDYGVDLASSFLVGDRLSDIQAAYNAGLLQAAHVLSGSHSTERANIKSWLAQTAENQSRFSCLMLNTLQHFDPPCYF